VDGLCYAIASTGWCEHRIMKRLWFWVMKLCRPRGVVVSNETPILISRFPDRESERELGRTFELLAGGRSGVPAFFPSQSPILC
jgi:hypothetical protein